MDFGDAFRAVWNTLTDSRCRAEWDEIVLMMGIFLLFAVIQWLMMKCRRRWVRYLPLLLMTVLWGLTEYLVAAESSMGAAVLVLWAGYPVVLGWTGTICASVIWHIRKLFHKTA